MFRVCQATHLRPTIPKGSFINAPPPAQTEQCQWAKRRLFFPRSFVWHSSGLTRRTDNELVWPRLKLMRFQGVTEDRNIHESSSQTINRLYNLLWLYSCVLILWEQWTSTIIIEERHLRWLLKTFQTHCVCNGRFLFIKKYLKENILFGILSCYEVRSTNKGS